MFFIFLIYSTFISIFWKPKKAPRTGDPFRGPIPFRILTTQVIPDGKPSLYLCSFSTVPGQNCPSLGLIFDCTHIINPFLFQVNNV